MTGRLSRRKALWLAAQRPRYVQVMVVVVLPVAHEIVIVAYAPDLDAGTITLACPVPPAGMDPDAGEKVTPFVAVAVQCTAASVTVSVRTPDPPSAAG
jgi:hypothetical protein